MTNFPLDNPQPDFDWLERAIRGQESPQRVPSLELKVDDEMMQLILEEHLGERWVTYEEDPEEHLRLRVEFEYRMGYHFVRNRTGWAIVGLPRFSARQAQDTADLSRGQRAWVQGSSGLIANWTDFHAIPWDQVRPDLSTLDLLEKHLYPGMKIMLSGTLFEMVLESLLGYENLFILSHDEPDLVKAVFDTWGQKLYDFYSVAIGRPRVGGIFHGDDLGHKTGTMMHPDFLRQRVLPWFQRYADLAHAEGKMFWLHSCGNLLEIMEDLIDYVGIDAYHSFQDVIMPVTEFHQRYGNRIGVLGGVDVDPLARLTQGELRQYVRGILDQCMPRGRYVLGSGNSVTNYVPPENYLAMLEEGLRWPD